MLLNMEETTARKNKACKDRAMACVMPRRNFVVLMKKKESICSLFSEATAECNAVLKN
jgi:hypothetical protein